MAEPSDWQILAVALLRRLCDKVELAQDEIHEARTLLDPVKNLTELVTYEASRLAPWPSLVTVELRTRPRRVREALDALVADPTGST